MTNLKTNLIALSTLVIFTLISINTNAQMYVVKEQLDADGNVVVQKGSVGIGTDTPTEKLDVNGSMTIKGGERANGNNVARLKIGQNREADGMAYFDLHPFKPADDGTQPVIGRLISHTTGITGFNHFGTNRLQFRIFKPTSAIRLMTPGDINALVVGPNGNVGIGESDPSSKDYKFYVNGDAGKTGTSEWNVVSDKRTKKNINSFGLGLNEVLKLNPVTFKYNGKAGIENNEKEYVGLVAQEFAEIMPNAVSKFTFTDTISNKTEDYLSMDPSSVRYMLVNGMKEQQALIETQKAELETLKETVAKLAENGASISTPGATEISVLLEGTGTESALLAQNMPNPFSTTTRIEYFIPTDSRNARMSFRDMTGKEIKLIDITNDGIGAIELTAKDLATGIYSYVLYVDGSIVASKKMVLK